jgi:hypothetical protein
MKILMLQDFPIELIFIKSVAIGSQSASMKSLNPWVDVLLEEQKWIARATSTWFISKKPFESEI